MHQDQTRALSGANRVLRELLELVGRAEWGLSRKLQRGRDECNKTRGRDESNKMRAYCRELLRAGPWNMHSIGRPLQTRQCRGKCHDNEIVKTH
eukprot:8697812-Pyramimonas_sp.AAC.1